MDNNILTAEQVADRLQVSKRKVLTLCRNGELHAKKIGKVWRITNNAVEEYIK